MQFRMEKGNKGEPVIVVDHLGKKMKFLIEQISAMVLGKIKEIAENHIGRKIS